MSTYEIFRADSKDPKMVVIKYQGKMALAENTKPGPYVMRMEACTFEGKATFNPTMGSFTEQTENNSFILDGPAGSDGKKPTYKQTVHATVKITKK